MDILCTSRIINTREQGRSQVELLYSFLDWDDRKIEVKKICLFCRFYAAHT